ncbi:MAG: DNA translocase FtsK [Dehalococcoidia bacterium]|nr:MAG: DNA translocase FtsK [Dehalococcoidia bacterium]
MAKRRATRTRNTPRAAERQPHRQPGVGVPLRIAMRLILVIAIVVAVVLFGARVMALGADVWEQLLVSFGLGLILLAIAIGVLIRLVWTGFGPLRTRWNVFLGAGLVGLGVWGLLALSKPAGTILWDVTLGGRAGQSILGPSEPWGIVRVSAMLLVGLVLIAPQPLVRTTRWLFHPRPRKAPRDVPFAYDRITSSPSSRSVLADDDSSPVERGTATLRSEPIKAPDALPNIIPEKRTFRLGRKEPDATPQPEAVPAIVPVREPVVTMGGWQIPPVDVLDKPKEIELNREEIDKRARLIEEALDSYGVEGKVVQINSGPTVTQFGVEPGWVRRYRKVVDDKGDERQEEVSRTRIRVDRITALSNDLALALAAPSIRIEAPIPGKSMVGIEVPNSAFGSVSLRNVIESTSYQKMQAKTKLALALGKGAGGESVAGDLTKMPHLLIAGSTGSGKTVCLDSIICCLLMHNSPDDVRLLLVDPKRVELVAFGEIPHLAFPVVVEAEKAVKVLRWLNVEMDRRYREFAKAKARNIESYNKDRAPGEAMPYLVLVVDELADLMMAAFDEVEHTLCRLAQLARATGIHLIVATQRPSVDVVTGLIKANFPTRISFAVTSQVDSRTILDTVGAEKLLGRGDMLYLPSEAGRPKRLQGTFVSDAEMERLVQFWSGQRRQEKAIVDLESVEGPEGPGHRPAVADPMLAEARKLAAEHTQISASFLQRRLRIGYPRAARIMEQLEMEGEGEENEEQPPSES